MNTTVASLTLSALLGKRRAVLLFVLPGLLIALAIVIRLLVGSDEGLAASLLKSFGMSPVVPLLGLLIGTGVIGNEIEDGSIVYLLSKPIARPLVVTTKLIVAAGTVLVLAALPALIAGLIVCGLSQGIAVGFFWGALAGGIAYSSLFLMLAVVSRHAVIIGLIYVLLWESLVGAYVPGARNISIQQWALSITGEVAPAQVTAAVSVGTGLALLVVLIVVTSGLAINKLRSLTLVESE